MKRSKSEHNVYLFHEHIQRAWFCSKHFKNVELHNPH